MPWNARDQMSLRVEFVSLASTEAINFSELCHRFNISRKTGYKWLKRYQAEGVAGLKDSSRAPQATPRKTPRSVEQAVVKIRKQHPTWGGRKIRRRLIDLGDAKVPAASTISNILHRHQLMELQLRPAPGFIRFERARPNELWQMDFKGHFKLRDGQRCDPLTLLDDHSRYNLCLKLCDSLTRETVQMKLEQVFRHYGMPWQMTMDNGGPWGSHGVPGATNLAVWLMKLGIQVSYSRPFHPQTQGKLERFHRTLKADVLQLKSFASKQACQLQFNQFRRDYNYERPHEALDYEVPAKRYQSSPRSFPSYLPAPEYDEYAKVRKVSSRGTVCYRGDDYFIGKAFSGENVAIKLKQSSGFDIFFGSFKIKHFEHL